MMSGTFSWPLKMWTMFLYLLLAKQKGIFDIRILITPLVSSNSSLIQEFCSSICQHLQSFTPLQPVIAIKCSKLFTDSSVIYSILHLLFYFSIWMIFLGLPYQAKDFVISVILLYEKVPGTHLLSATPLKSVNEFQPILQRFFSK